MLLSFDEGVWWTNCYCYSNQQCHAISILDLIGSFAQLCSRDQVLCLSSVCHRAKGPMMRIQLHILRYEAGLCLPKISIQEMTFTHIFKVTARKGSHDLVEVAYERSFFLCGGWKVLRDMHQTLVILIEHVTMCWVGPRVKKLVFISSSSMFRRDSHGFAHLSYLQSVGARICSLSGMSPRDTEEGERWKMQRNLL